MQRILHNIFRRTPQSAGLRFSRPLVVLQSDDWARVGVRDKEGFEQLRSNGLRLGEHPYDLYTLETANDVAELVSLLGRHRDSSGRSPCLVMNFCVANLDFPKMRTLGFKSIELLNLASGLPGHWSRPGLFEAYRQGIQYLLNTQLEDGSWYVRSRSIPFQPYFESGFPHGHDQWISAAATNWAAMALVAAAGP